MPGTRNRAAFLLRRTIAYGLFTACVVLSAPTVASGEDVKLLRNATSSFDPFITDPPESVQNWIRSRYDQMRGYAPYFDHNALEWSPPPTEFYKDAYAIYSEERGDGLPDRTVLRQRPNWVLRDEQGRPLYIPYDCAGGTCPQYAADFGNPEWRAYWIDQARENFGYSATHDPAGQGYKGIFVDDVNLELRASNGSGETVRPIDPRTGGPMTDQNWQLYMVEFVEEIRAAFPDVQITHNPLWWLPHSDPEVKRQVAAADVIELERGFNDAGLTSDGGTYGYSTFLRHVDWIHAQGRSVVLEPYISSTAAAAYEVASHLLSRSRNDTIAASYRADPPQVGGSQGFWKGWKTDPGRARGKRRLHRGLWQRRFSNAIAVTNPPDTRPRRIRFPRPRFNLAGKRAKRFRVAPMSGDVFFKRRALVP